MAITTLKKLTRKDQEGTPRDIQSVFLKGRNQEDKDEIFNFNNNALYICV